MTRAGLLLSLLFPPRCAVCDEVIPIGQGLCRDCCGRLASSLDPSSLCPRCGKPREECLCAALSGGFDGCLAVFLYREDTRRLFERLKEGDGGIAQQLAAMMLARWQQSPFPAPDAIVCVPPRPGRYDQVRALALPISRGLGAPLQDGLIFRQQNSLTQHTLSAKERWQNARASYCLQQGGSISGRVLLIDDIMTTGATLSACASLLRRAGAREIFCLTAATTPYREDPPSPDS